MWFFIVIAMIAFGIVIVSNYWIKVNEFYEWKFPEIKKYSLLTGKAAVIIALVWGIVSNIHISIEIKQAKEKFINPYESHFIYGSKAIELFGDVDKIVFSNSAKYLTGSYQIRARRVNEQLALDLKNIRQKNEDTMKQWFGTVNEDVNMVYCRDLNQEIVDAPDTKQTYTFEFYYTDVAKREEWRQEYKQIIQEEYPNWSPAEQDQLLNSYLNQADTDRAFEISKIIEVETDESGNIIITDEMRGFVSKKRLDTTSNVVETEGITVSSEDSSTVSNEINSSDAGNIKAENE